MLTELAWLNYAKEIIKEWTQCKDEGKDVDAYLSKCQKYLENINSADLQEVEQLGQFMASLPTKEGYEFIEPNDYKEIIEQSKKYDNLSINESLLEDKIGGAWIGRIAGCQLGKPIEGWRSKELNRIFKDTNNYPLERYLNLKDISKQLIEELKINQLGFWADNITDAAFADDDTNYTVLSLKLMERLGKNFKSDDVLEAWMENMPILAACTAERVAYKNAVTGMFSPETATYKNPYREWIGAQIRTDFYGYINPGKPIEAAELAYRDACISHTKNGIYGAMFAAAIVSVAFATDDTVKIIKAGISVIPQKSRLAISLQDVLNMYLSNVSFEEVINKVHAEYDEYTEYGWCHTIPNAMICAASILYSGGDFSKGICMAVQSAFDTDCNGATVGSVLGALNGKTKIQPVWYETFKNRLRTNIKDNENISVDNLIKRTIDVFYKIKEN